jgi:hypothetical protein
MSRRKSSLLALTAVLLPLAFYGTLYVLVTNGVRHERIYIGAFYIASAACAAWTWFDESIVGAEADEKIKGTKSRWLKCFLILAGVAYIAIVLAPLAVARYSKELALRAGSEYYAPIELIET